MRSAAIVLVVCTTALAGCSGEPAPAPDPLQDLYWPFLDVALPAGHKYALLTQWTTEKGPPPDLDATWLTERTAIVTGISKPQILGNLSMAVATDIAAPRFALGGFNATRADIYVFIDTDELLAHTESIPLQELNRVPWIRGNPYLIEDAVYYLGDGEAPEGTQPLPSLLAPFKDDVRDLAYGLPVGAASSIVVAQEDAGPAGSLYGDLYVAAQITELVYAP